MQNRKQIDYYSILVASKYFETIDDFINLELSSPRFEGNIEKLHFNPITLNETTKKFFPSLETLQKKSGIKSKSTLLKVRQSLVEKGLISYQKSGTKVYYSINIVPVQNFNRTGTDFNENESNFRLQTEVKQNKEQK